MNDERCYELLGLKGPASPEEIKAAYRDMAKVWHPDRFVHDPQLQRKAQEQLKEINEAYQRLTSPRPQRLRPSRETNAAHARTPREAHSAHHAHARHEATPAAVARHEAPRRSVLPVLAVAVAVAALAFFAAARLFVNPTTGKTDPAAASSSSEEAAPAEYAAPELSSSDAQRERKASVRQKSADAGPPSGMTDPFAPARALPTVTRTIDPTTGLLATRACPTRVLMTYPAGSEPQSSCSAEHAPAPAPRQTAAQTRPQDAPAAEAKGKSRLKTVVGTLTSPAKLFKKKKPETPAQP